MHRAVARHGTRYLPWPPARWRELDLRLKDLAGGKIDAIPELEEKTVEIAGVRDKYHFLATASVYL